MKRATELEFLRWFYCNADFGPAHEDVMDMLVREFERQEGKKVPRDYDQNLGE